MENIIEVEDLFNDIKALELLNVVGLAVSALEQKILRETGIEMKLKVQSILKTNEFLNLKIYSLDVTDEIKSILEWDNEYISAHIEFFGGSLDQAHPEFINFRPRIILEKRDGKSDNVTFLFSQVNYLINENKFQYIGDHKSIPEDLIESSDIYFNKRKNKFAFKFNLDK